MAISESQTARPRRLRDLARDEHGRGGFVGDFDEASVGDVGGFLRAARVTLDFQLSGRERLPDLDQLPTCHARWFYVDGSRFDLADSGGRNSMGKEARKKFLEPGKPRRGAIRKQSPPPKQKAAGIAPAASIHPVGMGRLQFRPGPKDLLFTRARMASDFMGSISERAEIFTWRSGRSRGERYFTQPW